MAPSDDVASQEPNAHAELQHAREALFEKIDAVRIRVTYGSLEIDIPHLLDECLEQATQLRQITKQLGRFAEPQSNVYFDHIRTTRTELLKLQKYEALKQQRERIVEAQIASYQSGDFRLTPFDGSIRPATAVVEHLCFRCLTFGHRVTDCRSTFPWRYDDSHSYDICVEPPQDTQVVATTTAITSANEASLPTIDSNNNVQANLIQPLDLTSGAHHADERYATKSHAAHAGNDQQYSIELIIGNDYCWKLDPLPKPILLVMQLYLILSRFGWSFRRLKQFRSNKGTHVRGEKNTSWNRDGHDTRKNYVVKLPEPNYTKRVKMRNDLPAICPPFIPDDYEAPWDIGYWATFTTFYHLTNFDFKLRYTSCVCPPPQDVANCVTTFVNRVHSGVTAVLCHFLFVLLLCA